MGSAGTNRLTDYSESSQTGGSRGGSQPATSGVNPCERAHGDISLEEVARCEYFKSHANVPPVDMEVAVRAKLEGGRLAVQTIQKAPEVIGYLPTKYLYLRKCMQQGFTYRGHVLASSTGKAPVVRIDLAPHDKPKK